MQAVAPHFNALHYLAFLKQYLSPSFFHQRGVHILFGQCNKIFIVNIDRYNLLIRFFLYSDPVQHKPHRGKAKHTKNTVTICSKHLC